MKQAILMIFTLTLAILALPIVGCQGAPEYGMVKNKTDSELDLGWGRKLRLGPDIEAELHGLKTANGTQIDSVIFKQAPSVTMAQGVVPTMYAYSEQQKQFVPILKQYGDNSIGIIDATFTGINKVAQTLMPAVNNLLTGQTTVAMAKQQTKQLQSEMIAGIAGGVLNPNEMATTMAALPEDVQRAVLSDPVVLAKLEQLAEQIKALAATTQPAA